MYELASRAFDKPNAFNTGNGTAGGNNTGQFDQEEFYRNFSKVGQITLQQILAGQFLGTFFQAVLQGIIFVQFVNYARHQATDGRSRYVVWLLVTLATFQTGQLIGWLFEVLVNNYGNRNFIPKHNWVTDSQFFINGIVTALVQAFYAKRLYLLAGGSRIILVFFGLTIPTTFALSIGATVAVSRVPTPNFLLNSTAMKITQSVQKTDGLVGVMLSMTLVVDMVIVGGTVWYLTRTRRMSSDNDVRSLLARLCRLAFASMALPSLCIFLLLVIRLAVGGVLTWDKVFLYCAAKLYVISMLHTLLHRGKIRALRATDGNTSPISPQSGIRRFETMSTMPNRSSMHSRAGSTASDLEKALPPLPIEIANPKEVVKRPILRALSSRAALDIQASMLGLRSDARHSVVSSATSHETHVATVEQAHISRISMAHRLQQSTVDPWNKRKRSGEAE